MRLRCGRQCVVRVSMERTARRCAAITVLMAVTVTASQAAVRAVNASQDGKTTNVTRVRSDSEHRWIERT